MDSGRLAVGSGCLFLFLGGFLLFGALMAIGVGIDAVAPALVLAAPEMVVAVALFTPRYRARGLVAAIVIGIVLTAYWVAALGRPQDWNAIGSTVVIFPLSAGAATLMAVASLALRRGTRYSRR